MYCIQLYPLAMPRQNCSLPHKVQKIDTQNEKNAPERCCSRAFFIAYKRYLTRVLSLQFFINACDMIQDLF